MAFSKSRHSSKIKLSSQEMFAISKEINSEFSPSFSSNLQEIDPKLKLAPKELSAISQEISREFSPELSNNSGLTAALSRQAQEPLRAPLQEPDRQSEAGTKGSGPELASQIKFAPNELAAISQEISVAFAPQFSSRLSEPAAPIRLAANELLEISREISREFVTGAALESPELILFPVDPYHLHAYWHVDEHIAATESKEGLQEPLTLRVYAQASASTDTEKAAPDSWFDLAVEGFQSHQDVSLPATFAETVYSAAIGKYDADNGFSVFAYSNITHPARGGAEPEGSVSRVQALSVSRNASGIGK